jgi:hypothetical protein
LHVHVRAIAKFSAGRIVEFTAVGVRAAEGIQLHAGATAQQDSADGSSAGNDDAGGTGHGFPKNDVIKKLQLYNYLTLGKPSPMQAPGVTLP